VNRPFGKQFFVPVLLALGLLVLGIKTLAPAQTKAAAAQTLHLKALGSKTAPITMEVFSDFQCPACRQLYEQTLRQVIIDYVAADKVYLVHRDFPLPTHKYSREAARYANAAARIGKFEKVEEALFTKQDVWSADGNIDAIVAAVLTPAEMKQVRQLVRNGQLDATIDKDKSLGNLAQVQRTPTTIITYRGATYPLVGVIPYATLRQFFDQLLSH